MDIALIIKTLLLGAVEGLTEFIPVSSTGHLILLIDLLGFKGPAGEIFEIVIQLGAILAICWVYREKLFHVAFTLHKEADSRHFALAVTVGFLPAAILGALLHDFIKSVLFSPWVVCTSLILGGIAILVIERLAHIFQYRTIDRMPLRTAFYIGFAQVLAMIPGVSRSGATIMGALLLGVERKTATEFSFFLAIPTMFGATAFDLMKNHAALTNENLLVIALGFISAFFSALLVVRTVIAFISTHGFAPFAYYRIGLGVIMMAVLAFAV